MEENTNMPISTETQEATDNIIDLSSFEYQYDQNPEKIQSAEELKELVEMGRFYKDKGKAKLESYKNSQSDTKIELIDKFMKQSGYNDFETYAKAVNEAETKQKIEREAKKLEASGLSQDVALKLAEAELDKKNLEDRLKNMENQLNNKSETDKFMTWHKKQSDSGTIKADINETPDEVFVKAEQEGIPIEQAYMEWYIKDLTTKTQQATLKSINQPSAKGIEALTGSPSSELSKEQINTQLSGMSKAEQRAWVKANYDTIEKSGYFK